MPGRMKTVRFSKVVEHSGAPEVHLVHIDPAKDRALSSNTELLLFHVGDSQNRKKRSQQSSSELLPFTRASIRDGATNHST